MNTEIGSTTMPSNPSLPIPVSDFSEMRFKLTNESAEKPASTRERRLKNWKNPICQLSIDLIIC